MLLLSQHQSLPSKSGVYLFRDIKKNVLYVGKAKDIRKRVSSYFPVELRELKNATMLEKAHFIDHIITSSEIEAFLLEANLIKKYHPFYNIKLADDKFYPYIKISKGTIPYIIITRKTDEESASYYGPYPSASSVKIFLKLLRRIFPYQSVRNHQKTLCFYNHIGLCPCIPKNPENLLEYKKNIRRIESFLKGNIRHLIPQLERERDLASKAEKFEKASVLQDKIEKINYICHEKFDPFTYMSDPQVYFSRIKKELSSLITILKPYYSTLSSLERIECFDISNIHGTNATGSMVVMTNGEADKSSYRRFKVRLKSTPDDFFMMKEVLQRRIKHDDWKTPDLIVIDGGKGQVSAAIEVLQKANKQIPLIGLAKREEIIVIPQTNSETVNFVEVKLPKSEPGINLLRRIRDEAHRFAVSYHRLLRKKSFLSL